MIASLQDEYQKEVTKKQLALAADEKVLDSKKSVLSKEAFDAETKKFEKKFLSLKKFVENKKEILQKSSLESMNRVNEKITEIINTIVKRLNGSIDVKSEKDKGSEFELKFSVA